MADEYKSKATSDEDKERSKEEQTSLDRQRARRELNKKKKGLQGQEDQELSNATSRKERNEIRAKADAALEQAEANFNETYKPSENKQDYESDILQRGIDQFTAPEATPESGSSSFKAIICVNGTPFNATINGSIGDEIT